MGGGGDDDDEAGSGVSLNIQTTNKKQPILKASHVHHTHTRHMNHTHASTHTRDPSNDQPTRADDAHVLGNKRAENWSSNAAVNARHV